MSPDRASAPPQDDRGVFVAVVGPSGVGKDTLMSRAARHPGLDPRVRFARRVVTREALVASEDHDSLDEAGFARAAAEGAFSLTWSAHGLRYALPHSTIEDLGRGRVVVGNLSRRSLADAVRAFGALWVVEVTARPDVLLDRLSARGRESRDTILDRLGRQVTVTLPPGAEGHLRIDNSDDVEVATERFVGRLNALCGPLRAGRQSVSSQTIVAPRVSSKL